jgi:hypothetical protein
MTLGITFAMFYTTVSLTTGIKETYASVDYAIEQTTASTSISTAS